MKHAQKMVIIPEHLLQSMETERLLTALVQLPTLSRLDQDMKQIIESPLPEDQKVLMLDQLLQRYQGLTQMKVHLQRRPGKETSIHLNQSLQKCQENYPRHL